MCIPDRALMFPKDETSAFVSMPAYSEEDALFITKVGAIVSATGDITRSTVNSVVVAYSGVSGALIATIDGAAVTNAKCAAVSALITQICTNHRHHTVAIIGAGVQAFQQFLAISSVRKIESLAIFSRGSERLVNFMHSITARGFPASAIRIAACVDDACRGASIIATTTTANTPIGIFSGLQEGIHINCMGGHTTNSREIPHEVLEHSLLIVEDRQTAFKEAGKIHEGALDIEQALIEDDLAKRKTIFSSVGHAFHDYLVVHHILKKRALI